MSCLGFGRIPSVSNLADFPSRQLKHPLLKEDAEVPKEEVEALWGKPLHHNEMGGGRGESGGRISPTWVGKRWMRFVVNVLAVLYCVVLSFFWRDVLASEVCVFTTAFLYICIYIQDIYIYTWFVWDVFWPVLLHMSKVFCDACCSVFSEVGLDGFSVVGNKLRLSLLMKLYFL